jgi:membrane fusion protein, copper/silver efflux system
MSMKKLFLLLMMGTALSIGATSCGEKASANEEYYCPMHPEVVQDKPGTCPKCNMNLEKREKGK